MSERKRYPAGAPCWVETLQPDPRAALDFYAALLGWEFDGPGPMPGDLAGEYYVARVNGRDVAGIGSLADMGGPPMAIWSTYVRVDSVDEAAERATAAGASLLAGPLDALPAGRLAVLLDPVGAAVCVWEARAREGAQLVNEPGTWAMSSLHTTDGEGAKAFYGSVFGWQPEAFGAPEAPMTLWRLPGYVGEAAQPIPPDVVAVMAPTGDAAAAVPPHWNVNL
ncbi:MAG TPA: VOC family protein, partial [Solirubrobacteraceae bacterium]